MRTVIGVLIAVGLGVGVWLLWPRSEEGAPATTAVATATTSTSTVDVSTTSTTATRTSSTVAESHVVETTEQAEEILRELWFGWFEGIYNQDEDRIREVVATPHQFDLAVAQFDQMTFRRAPQPTHLNYDNTEILLATEQCTVVLTTASLSGFTQASSEDVHVLRWDEKWRFFSLWAFRDDLWEADCEASLDS